MRITRSIWWFSTGALANAAITLAGIERAHCMAQGTVLVWPWSSAPWRVAESEMVDGTRIRERGSKHKRHQHDQNIPRCARSRVFNWRRNDPDTYNHQ